MDDDMTNNNIIKLTQGDRAAKAKIEAKEQESGDLLEGAKAFLDKHPFRYIMKLGCYAKKVGSDWVFFKPETVRPRFAHWDAKFARAVSQVMEQRGWSFDDATYSFRKDLPAGIFNMMDSSTWVQPEDGKHHFIFDVLMQSLGGGKAENIDHLEHVITYKYIHQDCFMLPCLLIHGEGGVGKNLLTDKVLKTLFDGKTVSLTSNHVINEFNSLVKGRAVVMINEAVSTKVEADNLKDLLHKEYLVINEKNIRAYLSDNTPMYIIASNHMDGGVFLDRSDADRRISVLRCERGKTLAYWLAKHMNCTPDEAVQWMKDEGNHRCGDRKEVGKWLGYLVLKHGSREQPKALHGLDYQNLLNVQQRLEDRLIESVFDQVDERGNRTFTHIERRVLYEGYLALCTLHKVKYPLTDTKFNRRVDDWLNVALPTITKQMIWISKTKRRLLWLDTAAHDINRIMRIDNAVHYLDEVNYKPRWIGTDI